MAAVVFSFTVCGYGTKGQETTASNVVFVDSVTRATTRCGITAQRSVGLINSFSIPTALPGQYLKVHKFTA